VRGVTSANWSTVKKTAFWDMGDAMTMEAVCTSETTVYFYKTTQIISQKASIFILAAMRT
jgi:hypothetical protein